MSSVSREEIERLIDYYDTKLEEAREDHKHTREYAVYTEIQILEDVIERLNELL